MRTSFFPLPNLLCAAMALGFMIHCRADSLAPPPYDIRDSRGVNVASGHVSPNLEDVKIGDAKLGLTHSISSFSSSFVNWDGAGPLGFRDRFYGMATVDVFSKPLGLEQDPNSWIYCMRVFDIGGSFDFAMNAGGTYTAMNGDPRNTLVFVPNLGLVWTKPDGTVVTFTHQTASYTPTKNDYHSYSPVSSIVYPNGFTIQVYGGDPVLGATTNTGYQLRYLYVQNTAPVDGDDPTNTEIPPASSINWSSTMPASVVAINNAIDYCPPYSSQEFTGTLSEACPGLTTAWPAASYSWPNGMPRAMYLRDASFKVTDSIGRVTEYMHHPYQKPVILNDPQFRVPRLVGIKSWNASVAGLTYDYVTKTTGADQGGLYPVYYAGPIAQLTSSTYDGVAVGYDVGQHINQGNSQFVNVGGDPRGANRVYSDIAYGVYEADLWDRTVYLEKGLSNRILQVSSVGSITTTYQYDARYNVKLIAVNGQTTQTALYPDTCANRKTCNQAIWIKDANGNQTDFEYDPNSGSVSRVQRPADKLGVRPETRYTYSPKYAYYKNSSGVIQSAASPVYLLTKEWTCAQTAMLGDGSGCSGGASDLVTTDYDYGPVNAPNNLQLRGVSVTAYVSGAPQIHRTCYSYDVYGNKIGQTSPNAGLASCY